MPLGGRSHGSRGAELTRKSITYILDAKNDKGTLHLNRALNVDVLLPPTENYATLRKVFQL